MKLFEYCCHSDIVISLSPSQSDHNKRLSLNFTFNDFKVILEMQTENQFPITCSIFFFVLMAFMLMFKMHFCK
jgi:hypothetical protein